MSKSLNRVIIEEYLKDLRSGNFLQGHYNLYYPGDNAYCSIGVFGETYRKIIGEPEETYYTFEKIVGIDRWDIIYRNDGVGVFKNKWSFSEIADYIEENSPVMEKEHV